MCHSSMTEIVSGFRFYIRLATMPTSTRSTGYRKLATMPLNSLIGSNAFKFGFIATFNL